MSFSMSPYPLRFGSRQGGGGDPTAITPANADALFTALGLTQAGTGTTWGETGQAATPLYSVDAAKVPLAYDAELGVFGPIANQAGTNLALHGRDATNAAWTKTNIAATLGHGDLTGPATFSGELWGTAAIVLTGSTNKWVDNGNGTYTKAAGATRNVESDFLSVSDLAWVEFTLSGVTGGTLTVNVGGTVVGSYTQNGSYTVGYQAGANGFVRFIGDASFAGTLGGISVKTFDKFHSILRASSANGTCLQAITSSSNPRVTKFWLKRESGSGTISLTQDNGSTWADVTPGDDPQPFNVAAATLTDPTFGIRIATSGDIIRLYRTQHQVASIPMRPSIGPTAGSTVTSGARTMICTLSESPSLVSLKLRFRTPTVSIAGQTVFSVDNNAATNLIDLKADGSGGFVLRKVIASSEMAFSAFAVAVNTLVQVDIEISASVFRYRIDGGSWVNGTAGIPGSLSRFRTGHDNANAGQLGQPVLALDELSTAAMMTGNRGWNKESLV